MRPGRLLFSAVLWLAALATVTFLVVPVAAIFQKVPLGTLIDQLGTKVVRDALRISAEVNGIALADRARRRHARVVPHRDAALSRPLRRDHAARAAARAATGRRRHRTARRLPARWPDRADPASARLRRLLPRERGRDLGAVRGQPVLPARGDRGVPGARRGRDGSGPHARREPGAGVRAHRNPRLAARRSARAPRSPSREAWGSSGPRSCSPATFREARRPSRSRSTASSNRTSIPRSRSARCSWCSAGRSS